MAKHLIEFFSLNIMIVCNRYFTSNTNLDGSLKSYMQSLKVKGQSTRSTDASRGRHCFGSLNESFNNRQRAHDGSGPMGFKRINIQVNSKQRCIMGTALHCG